MNLAEEVTVLALLALFNMFCENRDGGGLESARLIFYGFGWSCHVMKQTDLIHSTKMMRTHRTRGG
jgi:hypothetical protein